MNTLVKYRKIHQNSNVDESLFGTRTKSANRAENVKAVAISADELNRIRNRAALVNEADLEAESRAQELREIKENKCRERKEHMRRLEAQANSPSYKTELEKGNSIREQAHKKAAADMIDENSDVVKLLNSLSSRAIAFTIRDKQLEEAHRRAEIEAEYTRRMDMIMEVDRLKDLKRREELESQKAHKRVEDRKTITVQMEEKTHARLLEQEAKEQENVAMRNLMKKYELEEKVNSKHRKETIELSRAEILNANEDAIRRKREAKELEKRDVEEALMYMALKDQEMARREQEELERESKKKESQAKLLAQQERAQNNAGKLDELRARRAEEEKERQARRREREEALKRKEETEKLLQSRAAQADFKRQRELKDRALQLEEHRQALQYERLLSEKERDEENRKLAFSNQHRKNLEAQIFAEEEKKRMARFNKYDSGSQTMSDLKSEEDKLKAIRDKMVRDLVQKGVNPKYLGEMKAVDIGKILRR